MNEFIFILFATLPLALAFVLPIVILIFVLMGSRAIPFWVTAYFAIVFCFPNNSYGMLDAEKAFNLYGRGTGTFYFSAINVLLFALFFQAFAGRLYAKPLPIKNNLRWLSFLFGLILFGNLVVGLMLKNVRWFEIFGPSGLLNVLNLMLVFFVLMTSLQKPKDLDRFINVFLVCAVGRGVWGLFRFAVLNGDPANVYANFQHKEIRLTFFDINDSFVAAVALIIVAFKLLSDRNRSMRHQVMCWAIIALELFTIVFSYRRTAWGGLVIAAVFFAIYQRKALRLWLFASYIFIGLPLMLYKFSQRSSEAAHANSLLERLLPEIGGGGQLNFTTGRFAELYAAILSIKESPLFGLGAWGSYDATRFSELFWHNGNFTWMHSGLMHIMLKTGLVGVAIVIGLFIAYARFVRKAGRELNGNYLGIALAGAAGVLFMVPTLLIGTPVIEFRTMQLLGFALALPYMAYAAASSAFPTVQPVRAVNRFSPTRPVNLPHPDRVA